MLTAARSGKVRLAFWYEIDTHNGFGSTCYGDFRYRLSRRSSANLATRRDHVSQTAAGYAKRTVPKPARGGVYYEAGFAHGLGLQVIFTCRQDVIDKGLIHFDTRQYNHIAWNTPEELRKRLADRIAGTIGDGPAEEG